MNMNIEIQINDLQKEEFRFWVIGSAIILDSYWLYERESKRHKFKVAKRYDRIMKRNSTIPVEKVPLTEEIIEKAKQTFISKLIVATTL